MLAFPPSPSFGTSYRGWTWTGEKWSRTRLYTTVISDLPWSRDPWNRSMGMFFSTQVPGTASVRWFSPISQVLTYRAGIFSETGGQLVDAVSAAMPPAGWYTIPNTEVAIPPGRYAATFLTTGRFGSYTGIANYPYTTGPLTAIAGSFVAADRPAQTFENPFEAPREHQNRAGTFGTDVWFRPDPMPEFPAFPIPGADFRHWTGNGEAWKLNGATEPEVSTLAGTNLPEWTTVWGTQGLIFDLDYPGTVRCRIFSGVASQNRSVRFAIYPEPRGYDAIATAPPLFDNNPGLAMNMAAGRGWYFLPYYVWLPAGRYAFAVRGHDIGYDINLYPRRQGNLVGVQGFNSPSAFGQNWINPFDPTVPGRNQHSYGVDCFYRPDPWPRRM